MREEPLLQHIYARAGRPSANVTVPPGDDMGATRLGDRTLLVTVDQLADGLHVDLATTPLEKVARKAITRNLSDVAAMAATPLVGVVAATLPEDFGEDRANALFDAMHRIAGDFQCPLIGGDIAIWPHPLLLGVTLLATADDIAPVLRSTAKPGDHIHVTGALGGTLETLDGYTHHLDFTPRLDLAHALARDPQTRPHAMIDLSDGLGRDLARLCHASNLSATVEADALPVSRAAQQRAQHTGAPPWRHAVGDGEDYELLFTAPPNAPIPESIAGVRVTRIGHVEPADDAPAARLRLTDGSLVDLAELGWEHHA